MRETAVMLAKRPVVVQVNLGLLWLLCVGCGNGRDAATPTAPPRGSVAADATSRGDAADSAGSTPALAPAAIPASPHPSPRCSLMPFAASTPLPEASGVVLFEFGVDAKGRAVKAHGLTAALIVVGDSGNDGAFAVIHPDTGETLQLGTLPLGRGASDDLEGLAIDRGLLVAMTSSGWIRTWKAHVDDAGRTVRFELVDGPYGIAPANAACPGDKTNCGANYEGLCLRHGDVTNGRCAGFAAAKATNQLACLVRDHNRFRLDASRTLALPGKQALSGCDIDAADEAIWVGTNAFGAFMVYRVTQWESPLAEVASGATAAAKEPLVERMGPLGSGFPEAIAVAPQGVVYRFSDTSSSPSQQWKFYCR